MDMKKKQCSEIIEDYTMEILNSVSEAGPKISEAGTERASECKHIH